MNNNVSSKIKKLVNEIRESRMSYFYKHLWKGEKDFETLPFTNIKNFINTPLHERTYKKEKGLAKIVKRTGHPFLIQRALTDIKKENYGPIGKRPLVIFSDSHDALEKSLWCYENNILPLIGENLNLAVTAYTARRYEIDSILGDGEIIIKLISILEKEYDLKRIKNLTLIDCVPDTHQIELLKNKLSNVQVILGLPETGAFARQCIKCSNNQNILFFNDDNSHTEIKEKKLIVTKTLELTTPIIRYDTEIMVTKNPSKSELCKEEHFSLL